MEIGTLELSGPIILFSLDWIILLVSSYWLIFFYSFLWQAEVNYLGQLHHENLVKLIGYCLQGKNRLLVYEFMQKGSLENHLFRSKYISHYIINRNRVMMSDMTENCSQIWLASLNIYCITFRKTQTHWCCSCEPFVQTLSATLCLELGDNSEFINNNTLYFVFDFCRKRSAYCLGNSCQYCCWCCKRISILTFFECQCYLSWFKGLQYPTWFSMSDWKFGL